MSTVPSNCDLCFWKLLVSQFVKAMREVANSLEFLRHKRGFFESIKVSYTGKLLFGGYFLEVSAMNNEVICYNFVDENFLESQFY